METESEEREACLRRHRERDGARWASPTVDQTQARLEHNASYRHTHLQQLATNAAINVMPHPPQCGFGVGLAGAIDE